MGARVDFVDRVDYQGLMLVHDTRWTCSLFEYVGQITSFRKYHGIETQYHMQFVRSALLFSKTMKIDLYVD